MAFVVPLSCGDMQGVVSGADVVLAQPARRTIFALSSGRLPAAIAVVRISGPAAFEALRALTLKPLPAARVMTLTTIADPRSGAALDRALVVTFAADASVTGEPVVELHLHGSHAVVAAVLDALGALPGLTLAEPGEFTRQAFNHGKLDLTEVEGLADLIAATTEVQRVRALEAARGNLRVTVERWRRTVLDTLIGIESELDFAEEQADVGAAATRAGPVELLAAIRAEVDTLLAQGPCGERLRDGLTVAIVGPPNAGKSSLLNALVARDAAIVSPVPGTTRDLIELEFEVAGVPMTLIDTAGLRTDAFDAAEREGIVRARRRARTADLVLHVCTSPPLEQLGQIVINKIDLTKESAGYRDECLYISVFTGAGIGTLKAWLAAWARSLSGAGETMLVGTRRQTDALQAFTEALADEQTTSELVLKADALQAALRALSRLSGRYDVEEVLAGVFTRFCIGK